MSDTGTDDWRLHDQLQMDTIAIGDLPLCRVLLSNDANYPWLILVPRIPETTEIIDLSAADQAQLTQEIDKAARALRDVTHCHKLNVAALGNMVPQLHVHIIARQTNDAAWPKPIWGVAPPLAYEPAARTTFINSIAQRIGLPTK